MVKVCHYFLPTSSPLLCSLSSLLSLPCLCLRSSVQTVSVCLLDFQFRLSLPSRLLVHSLTRSCGKKAAKNLTPGSLILSFFFLLQPTAACFSFLFSISFFLFVLLSMVSWHSLYHSHSCLTCYLLTNDTCTCMLHSNSRSLAKKSI